MEILLVLISGIYIGIIVLISTLVLLVTIISILIFHYLIRKKYSNFILQHSVGVKKITKINELFKFIDIRNFDMQHSYDNEHFYDDISCEDYLIYKLVRIKKEVNNAIKDTLENKHRFEEYLKEIKATCVLNRYDVDVLLKNKKRLMKLEKELFLKNIQRPTIEFSINVGLMRTNIIGRSLDFKVQTFYPKEIKEIIFRINQKRGNFYVDEEIWRSICRVERGKVTNKLRFYIYMNEMVIVVENVEAKTI